MSGAGRPPVPAKPVVPPKPGSGGDDPPVRRPGQPPQGGIAMPGMGGPMPPPRNAAPTPPSRTAAPESPPPRKPAPRPDSPQRVAPESPPARKPAPAPPSRAPAPAPPSRAPAPAPPTAPSVSAAPRVKAAAPAPPQSVPAAPPMPKAHPSSAAPPPPPNAAKRKQPLANTNLRNAASAGKRAVRAEHLAAEVAKKGEEELDTTFKATQAKGAVDDMVLLSDLKNEAVVKNLKDRYFADLIYTYIGPVMISVNPYKRMYDVGPEYMKKYMGRSQHDVPPHIYAVADNMYLRLLSDQYNQCVIISGESGAGKTEAAKLVMNHVAYCSGGGKDVDHVKDVILQSNPLLEAFGNAKTLRNNNSSRFGKLMEIQFDRRGRPVGGVVTNFLLEKSRVVGQLKGERNFHIFYQLLAGAPDEVKEYYGLYAPENYSYLAGSKCYTVDGVDDKEEFEHVLTAMSVIGLTEAEQNDLVRILASVLHVGNIQFEETDSGSSMPQDQQYVDFAASLLGVDPEMLAAKLTSRQVRTNVGARGSVYDVPFAPLQAVAARDALAKALYARTFDYLIERLNKAMSVKDTGLSLNVLDIYGFEIFEKNGFEQFCINYVNEKLQQIFIDLTLQSEQDDYMNEGINWTPIKFFNNKIVCDLIESRRPPGVLAVLDDVCKTMHREGEGVDIKFLQKAEQTVSNPHFIPRNNNFTIKHYAGDVTYDVDAFVEKNKDVLFKDLIAVMQSSDVPFIANLFPDDISDDSRKAPTTFGHKIYTQAQDLVKKLRSCEPHYVRCIKPNENKRPHDWDEERVLHQVKYLGLLENIRVRRAGFAYRGEYERFIRRYNMCHVSTRHWKGDPRKGAEKLMRELNIAETEWRMGKSKMFVKSPEILFGLDDLRDRTLNHYATKIQRFWWRHDPEKMRILAEKQYWWDMMVYLFQNVRSDPAFGKSVEWPEYQEHLTNEVSYTWQIFENWRASQMINQLSPAEQEAMRQKIVSYDLFHGKKPWPCNREFVGNYLSKEQYYKDAAAYRTAEHKLLSQQGEKVVIFCDIVTKINKYYKAKDVALMVTADNFYKYDYKKYKQIKKPIKVSAVQSVSMSPFEDTFVVVHMAAPERDLLINLSVDKHNKVAEFVTMLYQSYYVLNGKPLPVNFAETITVNLGRTDKDEGKPIYLTFQRDPESTGPQTSRFVALKKPSAVVYYTP